MGGYALERARDRYLVADELRKDFSYDPGTGELRHARYKGGNCRAGMLAGHLSMRGYIEVGYRGTLLKAHRIIWTMMTGHPPLEDIDHINGIGSDNRWANLRSCPHSKNTKNARLSRRNTLGVKGVSPNTGRGKPFKAQIQIDKKKIGLGYFDTIEEAKAAYDAAAKKHHQEFART